jgi:diguanylate cyclase (GGDEF)-like protein
VLIGDASNVEEAQTVARRVEERLRAPFTPGGRTLRISASIGLAIAEAGDDHSADDFLRKADSAMYEAKNSGKSRLRVFSG